MSDTPDPADPAPNINRLRDTFASHDFSAHPSQWDKLWKESYTPWDRGGPSLALSDLLTHHRHLFPHSTTPGTKPTALVPGCGRGHDVLLLSSLGYDATGVDVSDTSLAQAAQNEAETASDPAYAAKDASRGKGRVSWVRADFFAEDEGSQLTGKMFDLVFDYTFFVALPPEARPKWARRMAQLVKPDGGRLVCLEWPLLKDPSAGGPPWACSREAYLAHLSRPGEAVEYGPDGRVAQGALDAAPSPDGLELLFREKPARTHKAGYDEAGNVIDYVSVWGHHHS